MRPEIYLKMGVMFWKVELLAFVVITIKVRPENGIYKNMQMYTHSKIIYFTTHQSLFPLSNKERNVETSQVSFQNHF